jgi:hypothetical protein
LRLGAVVQDWSKTDAKNTKTLRFAGFSGKAHTGFEPVPPP